MLKFINKKKETVFILEDNGDVKMIQDEKLRKEKTAEDEEEAKDNLSSNNKI